VDQRLPGLGDVVMIGASPLARVDGMSPGLLWCGQNWLRELILNTSNGSKRHMNTTALWSAWLIVFCWPLMAAGQDFETPTIIGIEFEGLSEISPGFVSGIVGLSTGDPLNADVLDQAVGRLLRSGRFLSANCRTREEAGGVRVIFELHERPMIRAIRFEGNDEFRDGVLRALVGIKRGDRVDRFQVREGVELITTKYRDAGYGDVVVTYDEEILDKTGALVYRIKEGTHVRIRKIVFEGASTFTPGKLKRQISTRTTFWFIRSGVFDEDTVENDVSRIESFYRGEGFLDVKASYRREPGKKAGDLKLVFTIDEGTRYKIENIDLVGNEAFSTEELLRLTVSSVGESILRHRIEADIRAIQTLYGEHGHIYADVRVSRVFSNNPGFVLVTFSIDEGEQFRVGRVDVRGNTRTRDKVARRALNLYPPDDLWNLTEAREAERRLRETRIFETARVLPVGSEPGVRDVIIDVQEVERAGDFLFGAGITSNSGVVGSIVLDLKNFDLHKPPRDFSELVKFKSFFGGGQHMRFEFQPGTELTRFRIDFTEPYFRDKPMRLGMSSYLFERGRDGYNEQRAGGNFSLGRRFERGWLQGWTGEVALRVEGVSIRDIALFSARDIHDVDGLNLITSLKGTLVRDRTDSRFVPTTGDRTRFSYEQTGVFGGDFTFGKLQAGYTWYKTLHTDPLDRKHVLQLRSDVGIIIGDAPMFERFYAGGIGSVRGFSYRGIGPRQGIDDNNIGGDWMFQLGGEYSFPLTGDNVRGLFFVDTGTVESGVRMSVGAGVRLTVDFLGPLPLEFNLGIPILKEDGDDTQAFSFFIGTKF